MSQQCLNDLAPTLVSLTLYICPGMHALSLTQDFLHNSQLQSLCTELGWQLAVASSELPPWSGFALREWMLTRSPAQPTPNSRIEVTTQSQTSLAIISFSAGVVGAIAAAQSLATQGWPIAGFVAIDGWGVPLQADFPIYRLSHDQQTHQDCCRLGAGNAQFYADPAVPHLELWRSPHQVWGHSSAAPTATTAAQFLQQLIRTMAIAPR